METVLANDNLWTAQTLDDRTVWYETNETEVYRHIVNLALVNESRYCSVEISEVMVVLS